MSNQYPGYKLFFVDTETTGTDPKIHNIFQLSGVITDWNLNVLDEIDLRFRPFSLEFVEQEALDKTKMTLDDLNNLPMSAGEAYNTLLSLLGQHCNKYDKTDKMHFVGYNAKFDNDFIREFFKKHNDNYMGSWFWSPPICVMQEAAWMTQRVRGAFPNFKLGTVCTCAEIPWNEDDAHDAKYDIKQTMELYQYLRDRMPAL